MNIITPEEKPQIITPFEQEVLVPSPESLKTQGAFLIKENTREEEIQLLQLENLKKQNTFQLRQVAATMQQAKQSEEMNQLLQSGSSTETLALALGQIQQSQQDNRLALEKEVIKTLSTKRDLSPTEAFVEENDLSFLQVMQQRATKELAIHNKLQELKEQTDYTDYGLNLLSEVSFVSFLQRTFGFGVFDYGQELRDLQTKLEQATPEEAITILEETEELARSTEILGSNPVYLADVISGAFQGSRDDQAIETLLHIFDFADTGFVAFKGLKGLGKAAIDLNAQAEVAKDIANSLGNIVTNPDDAIFSTMGVRTEYSQYNGIAPEIRKELEANERILQQSFSGSKALDYAEVQKLDVQGSLKEKLKRDFTNGSISDIVVKGDGTSDVTILRPYAQPYASESAAKGAITRRGIPNAVPFEISPNKWAIKANVDSVDASKANLSTKAVNFFRMKFGRT